MALSDYHQQYSEKSDEDIQQRANVKNRELQTIFSSVPLITDNEIVQIAVLGCADKRLISHHQAIFQDILSKPVQITTLDITIEHLAGKPNIIKHDVTNPLPNGLYDITYSHILLKFIPVYQQFSVIKNSINALKEKGLAIHILNAEDYTIRISQPANGYWSVPTTELIQQLKQEFDKLVAIHQIPLKLPKSKGLALVIQKL